MGFKHILNITTVIFYLSTTWLSQQAIPDSTLNGNYLILECGPRADSVKTLLDHTSQSLQSLISSLDDPNSPPYKAFFNNVDPETVKAVYSHMTAGTNITVWISSRQPTLVCVNGPESEEWEWCHSSISLAGHVQRSQYILLCNKFFDKAVGPAPKECGRTNRAKTALIDVPAYTQYGILVHELVHLYLQEKALTPEVYDINECIALPSEAKAANPGNYEYLAQSIQANCTDFPTPRRSTSPDRELISSHVSTSSNISDTDLSCNGVSSTQTCQSP